MKSYCIRDKFTNHIFKILLTEEELKCFLNKNSEYDECIDCIECDDAPSICIE